MQEMREIISCTGRSQVTYESYTQWKSKLTTQMFLKDRKLKCILLLHCEQSLDCEKKVEPLGKTQICSTGAEANQKK